MVPRVHIPGNEGQSHRVEFFRRSLHRRLRRQDTSRCSPKRCAPRVELNREYTGFVSCAKNPSSGPMAASHRRTIKSVQRSFSGKEATSTRAKIIQNKGRKEMKRFAVPPK